MQLEDFILYLDENLHRCQPILDALTANEIKHECYGTWFPNPGVTDEVWLPFVAERSWVVLTKDKNNRYNELERDAIRRHKVREFYFSRGGFTGTEMATAVITAIAEMKKICRTTNPPTVASITRTGIVTVLYDENGSTHERRKEKTQAAQSIG